MHERAMVWAGRALSAFVVLFLLGASVAPKLLGMKIAGDTLAQLGWNPRHVLALGLIELVCTLLYAMPRTSVLGAILTTALLGGAIATNWRADQPLYSHILFGFYLGIAMWAGLWLRAPTLRSLLPLHVA
ncbi:MAG: DoxX family protein [Bosea sp. (in: a-proteobacteria)]